MSNMVEKAAAVVQVFDAKFADITSSLPMLKALGFSHVQISPVQQHCTHTKKWYRLYQPTSLSIGNTLGNENQLIQLIHSAHQQEMQVIVDVVLHHTCGCVICTKSGRIAAFSWAKSMGYKIVSSYFGKQYEHERFNMQDWGPKQRTECAEIFGAQLAFLQKLVDFGVDGFRFDAAKHIAPGYFAQLKQHLHIPNNNHNFIMYGEVMDGDVNVCNEYVEAGIHVVDFPLVYTMIDAFSLGRNIRNVMRDTVSPWKAIRMADCHDSILGNSYKFSDPHDGLLAVCFILGTGDGIPLVYVTIAKDPHVVGGLKFLHRMKNIPFSYAHDI
jgi:alpha-amylase